MKLSGDANAPGKRKTNGKIIFALFLIIGLTLLIYSSYRITAKVELDAKATGLRARTAFIVQRSTDSQWNVVTTTFSSDTEKCPVSVTVLPEKTNVVLMISADGNLWRSTD
jgi:hypothetical protein